MGNYSAPNYGTLIFFGKNRENKIFVSPLLYYEKWITFYFNRKVRWVCGLKNHRFTITAR